MKKLPLFLLCPALAALIFSSAPAAPPPATAPASGLPQGVVVRTQADAHRTGVPEGLRAGQQVQPPHPVPPAARPPRDAIPPYQGRGGGLSSPAQTGGLVQMQFDNIELRDLIRFVSNIMGKNFVYDETLVKGRVTVLSPRSLSKDEVFRVFESVLSYFGFTVMPTPEAYKIIRSADAKGMPVETLDPQKFMTLSPEERVTRCPAPPYLDTNTMVGF
jgi:general secretion pathway protein D